MTFFHIKGIPEIWKISKYIRTKILSHSTLPFFYCYYFNISKFNENSKFWFSCPYCDTLPMLVSNLVPRFPGDKKYTDHISKTSISRWVSVYLYGFLGCYMLLHSSSMQNVLPMVSKRYISIVLWRRNPGKETDQDIDSTNETYSAYRTAIEFLSICWKIFWSHSNLFSASIYGGQY